RALAYAAALAARLPGILLTLFHVGAPTRASMLELDTLPEARRTREKLARYWTPETPARPDGQDALLERLRQQALELGVPPEAIELLRAESVLNVPVAIAEEMGRGNYDTVCLGRKDRTSVGEKVLGNVAERLLRQDPAATLWLVA
ncbi:MAG TPA: universal stress protein, partial [Desulfuromonadales bacterium]|nr:universal stress protein [Desulfuromonadales bacterium]